MQRATSYLGRLGASMLGFGGFCQGACRCWNAVFLKAVTFCKTLAWRFCRADLWFRCGRGFLLVDLKNPANTGFLFFFSNDLLSFNPFAPTIRLRFQTLFDRVLSRTCFESCTIDAPHPVSDFPDGSLARRLSTIIILLRAGRGAVKESRHAA